ncbi:UNVERIFIED_CONTAM: Retrovirus-related Pol polyprotein from transposon RE1 [Sesamum radiatum]|uniref:Retrovirus-related Pol polyprotein from transposon RE1 n=1 Tax=Sesamum radiatum TaxID=300843 RepID=A0AAW2N8G1_SESRA
MLSNTSPIYGPHSYESTRGPVMAMAQEARSHFNFQGLKNTTSKENDDRLTTNPSCRGACEACLQGKQHRKPFLQELLWRAKAVLELIHTDVCGPMRTPSHEKTIFILFIDDYSRMTWVYFMREKSEVFKVFKKFKNLVEKQSRSIKVLRSDRGKRYNNSEFDKFCEEEVSAMYIFQQRKGTSWREKTEKGIFLGYSTESKGYRIYNLKTKKLIISRDVEFDEDAMWNWDEEKVERQSVMIPKETPPQQQQEEGTDQAEMERRSQQAPGSPRRPPPSERLRRNPAKKDKDYQNMQLHHVGTREF